MIVPLLLKINHIPNSPFNLTIRLDILLLSVIQKVPFTFTPEMFNTYFEIKINLDYYMVTVSNSNLAFCYKKGFSYNFFFLHLPQSEHD